MRRRNMKPEITKHEELAQLSRDHRLFFQWLWMLCDSQGRTQDRPVRIKTELFPYDEDVTAKTVDGWLSDLAAKGFLRRYEAQGLRVIEVRNFRKHQSLPTWEKNEESELPQPPGEASHSGATAAPPLHRSATTDAPQTHNRATAAEPQTSHRGTTEAPQTHVALSIEDRKLESEEGSARADARAPDAAGAAPPPSLRVLPKNEPLAPASPGPTLRELQQLWNERMPHPPFPRWDELGDDQSKAAKRVRERPLDGERGWLAILARIAVSGFCRGDNDRSWVADPDFLLRQATPRKVLEGKYDDRGRAPAREPEYATRYL